MTLRPLANTRSTYIQKILVLTIDQWWHEVLSPNNNLMLQPDKHTPSDIFLEIYCNEIPPRSFSRNSEAKGVWRASVVSMITKHRSNHRSDHNVLENEKVDSLRGWMLQKIPIISKNSSNKNCSELNFLQKTQWTHVSISSRNEATGFQRLPLLKYYHVLEWKSRLALGLNVKKKYRLR